MNVVTFFPETEACISSNGNIKHVVCDWDDLADGNDRLDILLRLKDRDPGFRCTLFAIPARCNDKLFAAYDTHREWISLGIHGLRHSRHEALGWTQDEAEAKMAIARSIYPAFAPIFKAPNWQMTDEVYAACKNAGLAVADHISNVAIMPKGTPHYIYNMRIRNDHLTRMHGHIQPTAYDKGLADDFDKWAAPPIGSEYHFIADVLTTQTPLAE